MRALIFLIAFLFLMGCDNVRSYPPIKQPNPFVSDDWARGLDVLFVWSNSISILMIAACIAVLFWIQIPALRRWAWMGLTFSIALLAIAISFSVMKPFIPWIVVGSFVIMVGVGIYFLIRNFDTLKQYVHKDKDDLTEPAKKLVEVCEQIPLTK